MNLQEITTKIGADVADRLRQDLGQLEDYSRIEIEIVALTLQDERATRLQGRLAARSVTLRTERSRGHNKHPRPLRQVTSRVHYGSSPLGQFATMFELPVCVICMMWGGVVEKPRGRGLCGWHKPRLPWKFICETCGAEVVTGGEPVKGEMVCDGKVMIPKWSRLPEGLDHLKCDCEEHPSSTCKRPKIEPWMYAQLAQGKGEVRGLETLSRICDSLGLVESEVLRMAWELKGLGR